MYTDKTKASRLRQNVLLAYRDLWEEAPAKNQYAITENLWSPIWTKWKGKIPPDTANAVLAHLQQEGLVEHIVLPNPQGIPTPISRITQKGLMFLSDTEQALRTQRLAMMGAITGSVALLVSVLGLVLQSYHLI